jgi:hypothetical protein
MPMCEQLSQHRIAYGDEVIAFICAVSHHGQ